MLTDPKKDNILVDEQFQRRKTANESERIEERERERKRERKRERERESRRRQLVVFISWP